MCQFLLSVSVCGISMALLPCRDICTGFGWGTESCLHSGLYGAEFWISDESNVNRHSLVKPEQCFYSPKAFSDSHTVPAVWRLQVHEKLRADTAGTAGPKWPNGGSVTQDTVSDSNNHRECGGRAMFPQNEIAPPLSKYLIIQRILYIPGSAQHMCSYSFTALYVISPQFCTFPTMASSPVPPPAPCTPPATFLLPKAVEWWAIFKFCLCIACISPMWFFFFSLN